MATQVILGSGVVDSAAGLKLRTNGSTEAVDISTAQVVTLAKDAVINGLTVGKGAGAVSTNTAVGTSALAAVTTALQSTAVGQLALANNTTGDRSTAVGRAALNGVTTGTDNTGIGANAANNTTTGSYNVALGSYSLNSNTTGSYNTAVGYLAGYTGSTTNDNTMIGYGAGYASTGSQNTFLGDSAGISMTTGAKNTIVGRFTGNAGGLDIRTASNYIVLSDGDGNPRFYSDSNGFVTMSGPSNSYAIAGNVGSTNYFVSGSYAQIYGGSNQYYACKNLTGGVYLNGTSATSWTAASDERLKENLVPIENGLIKVCSLRSVIGNYTFDEEKIKKPFLIAQDVQAVLPEAVTSSVQSKDDPTEYLGVAYTEVIPLLVAAIKELKATVDAQQVEIDTLKGQA